jgi:uncharacterized membrane protein YraQ (UPF0718 family)
VENQYTIAVENFILNFTSILYEALPFIILGSVIAGVLEEMVPQKLIARVLPRNATLAIVLGALLGLVFPMCECGIIPIMRRLLRKGLPLSCCVAYLLAGPVINVVVLLSTWVAFSGMERATEPGGALSFQMGSLWMTGLRAALAFVVAVVTAHVVEWQFRRHGTKLLMPLAMPAHASKTVAAAEEEDEEEETRRPVGQRLGNIAETSLHDFIDITVFLILGALLASTVGMLLKPDQIAQMSRSHVLLSIALMMGLAIVLVLCSEADAFVAASFTTLRPSAKLAFLVLGPMVDLKLYLMYTRVFRPRLIWTIFLTVIAQVFVYSYAVHLLWERFAPQLMGASP